MFVERMELLEYHQNIEVELSIFHDSNTETPRKVVLSIRVCFVYV